MRRPDGGPFFDQNVFLFLSKDELAQTTRELNGQMAFLALIAADPSLHASWGRAPRRAARSSGP